jgi:hypothetical protein
MKCRPGKQCLTCVYKKSIFNPCSVCNGEGCSTCKPAELIKGKCRNSSDCNCIKCEYKKGLLSPKSDNQSIQSNTSQTQKKSSHVKCLNNSDCNCIKCEYKKGLLSSQSVEPQIEEEYYEEPYYSGLGDMIGPYMPCEECIENNNGIMCYKCKKIYNPVEENCNRGMNCTWKNKGKCTRKHIPVPCFYNIECEYADSCLNIHRGELSNDCRLFGLGKKKIDHIKQCLKCGFESNYISSSNLAIFYRDVIVYKLKIHTVASVNEIVKAFSIEDEMIYKDLIFNLYKGNILECGPVMIGQTLASIPQMQDIKPCQRLFVSTSTDRALTYLDYYTLGDFVELTNKSPQILISEFLKNDSPEYKTQLHSRATGESNIFAKTYEKFIKYLYDTYAPNANSRLSYESFLRADKPITLLINYLISRGMDNYLDELRKITGYKGDYLMLMSPPQRDPRLSKSSPEFIPTEEPEFVERIDALTAVKTFCGSAYAREICKNDLNFALNCYYIMEAYDVSLSNLYDIYTLVSGVILANIKDIGGPDSDKFYKKYGVFYNLRTLPLIRLIVETKELGGTDLPDQESDSFKSSKNGSELIEDLSFEQTIQKIINWIFIGKEPFTQAQISEFSEHADDY